MTDRDRQKQEELTDLLLSNDEEEKCYYCGEVSTFVVEFDLAKFSRRPSPEPELVKVCVDCKYECIDQNEKVVTGYVPSE